MTAMTSGAFPVHRLGIVHCSSKSAGWRAARRGPLCHKPILERTRFSVAVAHFAAQRAGFETVGGAVLEDFLKRRMGGGAALSARRWVAVKPRLEGGRG